MKIYLAGPCDTENHTIMWKIATALRNSNKFQVYCPWEYQVENAWTYTQEDWASFVFNADITAIKEADIVLVVSVGRESTAGTNWEQGFAYGLGKDIVVIQITNNSTSLMTYCGCDMFFNLNKENVDEFNEQLNKLVHILQLPSDLWTHDPCKTVLT